MKFILWTLVWFGIRAIEQLVDHHTGRDKAYNDSVRGWAAIITVVLWIVMYKIFIE